jgi:hypothetical protein
LTVGCNSSGLQNDGSGGHSGAGGRDASGGSTSTVTGSGGGATVATGGKPGSGGAGVGGADTGGAGSGGAPAAGGSEALGSGGKQATGGTVGSGGAGSGGRPGSGGSASTGGVAAGTGGTRDGGATGPGTGGSTTPGTSTPGTPSAGCGKTSTLKFTTVPGESGTNVGTGQGGYVTITSGGQSRGFAMRLPDNYDNSKPYWLIFGFHWNGGNSKEVDSGGSNGYEMAHFGLQKLSKNGAIFVAPDGLSAGWANSGGRDLTFVDDMVKLIEDNYCVDTAHLFANGFSYGGGMSYEIACARAKVFKAVAIYEGAQLSGCDGGNDPIAFWQMAGLTDTTCTLDMGKSLRDKFVKNNGCTAQTPPQPPQPPPYLATGGHVCTNYAGCSTGHPLRWCVHQSGHGNAIVDGTSDLYNTCATPPKSCSTSCPCSWVPTDVWSFFTGL